MPETPHRIGRLAGEAAATSDPTEAIRKLRELRGALDDYERTCVGEALHSGASFGDVAKALGVSRQAAHNRFRDLAPGANDPPPLSSQALRAIHLAREEAESTGTRLLGSEHLLIGVLRSGGAAGAALDAAGVTVEAARKCTAANGTAPDERAGTARAILAGATEIARARRARHVEADHIALAALNCADGRAARAVSALGIRPAAVRDRLS